MPWTYSNPATALARASGLSTQDGASATTIPIRVIGDILVSSVTTRPLSLDEIRAKGIVIDDTNFKTVNFQVAFNIDGQPFTIDTNPAMGDSQRVSTSYAALSGDVHSGDRLLLSDGLLELRVTAVRDGEVQTQVVHGGLLRENQGISAAPKAPAAAARINMRRCSKTSRGVISLAAIGCPNRGGCFMSGSLVRVGK